MSVRHQTDGPHLAHKIFHRAVTTANPKEARALCPVGHGMNGLPPFAKYFYFTVARSRSFDHARMGVTVSLLGRTGGGATNFENTFRGFLVTFWPSAIFAGLPLPWQTSKFHG